MRENQSVKNYKIQKKQLSEVMELNQFLFPAPTPSYSSSGFIGEIIYVPKYARDAETGEVAQFVDPDYKATEKD